MALIHIELKDIYAAYYTLERLESIPTTLLYLHTFLDGAVSIIKKKFEEGIILLEKVLQDGHNFDVTIDISIMIRPIARSYRAYALFYLGNINSARHEYIELREDGLITSSDEYNLELCQGIIDTKEYKFERARSHFKNAHNRDKCRIEPRFYLAILDLIEYIHSEGDRFDEFIRMQQDPDLMDVKVTLSNKVMKAIETLQAILDTNDSCSNLSFYIGFLKLSVGIAQSAIENFDLAMDKSDDNHAHHFLWKGIALAMHNNYEQALNEFRVSLSIDPTYFLAGLYKGRCYLYMQEVSRAFNAFHDFINEGPEEAEIKYWVGNFFFVYGISSHANKAYLESLNIKSSEDTLRELYKSFIVEKNLVKALDVLHSLQEDFHRQPYRFDAIALEALRKTSSEDFKGALADLTPLTEQSESGLVFKDYDVFFYIGICYVYLKSYSAAINCFKTAESKKYAQMSQFEFHEVEALNQIFDPEPVDEEKPLDEGEPIPGQTFTYPELMYNLGLAYLLLGSKIPACEYLRQCGNSESRTTDKITLLIQALEGDERASYALQDESSMFPFESRLCGIYEALEIPITGGLIYRGYLSFCLPIVRPPDIKIKVGYEILKDINITIVENRPEAPWIKKGHQGIMFTNEVINDEVIEVETAEQLIEHMMANNKETKFNTKVKLKAEHLFEQQKEEVKSTSKY